MNPFQDVGKAITNTLGVKVSKTGQTLIGGALIGFGAWWLASKFNVLPPNLNIHNYLPLP